MATPLLGSRDTQAWPSGERIAPHYLKLFVLRQNDYAADAGAIVIAAQRSEMRVELVKCTKTFDHIPTIAKSTDKQR